MKFIDKANYCVKIENRNQLGLISWDKTTGYVKCYDIKDPSIIEFHPFINLVSKDKSGRYRRLGMNRLFRLPEFRLYTENHHKTLTKMQSANGLYEFKKCAYTQYMLDLFNHTNEQILNVVNMVNKRKYK